MGFFNWLFGTGDKKKKEAELKALQDEVTSLKNVQKSNPAQNFLTTSAIDAANQLKAGDFSQLPKGQFFNFNNPIEEAKQFENFENVGKEGRFALADNGGMTNAFKLAGDFRKNKFARDASQNFQDNVANASANVTTQLGQAAGATNENNMNVINAMTGLYRTPLPKGDSSNFMNLLSGGIKLASAFI